MQKVILVDGNNLLFRSYYATAYTGNIMRNSKGFPTNGLFGFVNMMNKIITEEDPKYIVVAFDIGKTFRHLKYDAYKGGRAETPDDLKAQFPVAKKILDAMGVKYIEKEGYEADDIIGTFARMVDENDDYNALIVSSDKDLLQLISDEVSVKLLKTKDYIMMTPLSFYDIYGIKPIRMIDLKSLMGDASDNIPGVKGIGEKTALKLLQQYGTLEEVYENLSSISGALHNKLVEGKESAFMSKEMVTIDKHVPIVETFDDVIYKGSDNNKLIDLYQELEFHSFLKGLNTSNKESDVTTVVISEKKKFNGNIALWLEIDSENYHDLSIVSLSVYDGDKSYYIEKNNIDFSMFRDCNIYTYDAKKLKYILLSMGDDYSYNICEDVMIMAYLINYNVKDDIAFLAADKGVNILYYDKKKKYSSEMLIDNCGKKAKFIYDIVSEFRDNIKKEEMESLYYDVELPLTFVLARMEYTGINCDKAVLSSMGKDITSRIDIVSKEIYDIAGCEFNINSPKQLGDILFETLELPYGKKNKKGSYSTDATVLSKLVGYPIVDKVLEYRMLTKLYSTYIEGLISCIHEDGKIHTIFTQTLTRTGRLSSINPNLQNIPVRNEYGKLIRKAFKPDAGAQIMSCDYSQIELRMFASLAKEEKMINAFKNGIDIHTKTASDVFGVPIESVTKEERRRAKAVNFGIIYGISSYGLATDLGIKPKEAKEFIDSYFATYPGVHEYMEKEVSDAKDRGYVRTIMNRKRVIDELYNSNYMIRSMGERMAMNTPIQGSSADILKKAMVDIDKRFKMENIRSKMLLQVHDELIFNVYDDERDRVVNIVKELMENVYKLDVPLEVSVDFGNDWYDAK